MAGRSSAIGRVIAYFKETDIEEAQAAYDAVSRIVLNRQTQGNPNKSAVVRKARKPRANSPTGDDETRARRLVAGSESLADA